MSHAPIPLRLRFPESQVNYWAGRFPSADVAADKPILERIRPRALDRGYLTRAEFLALCRWKSARSGSLCRENTAGRIRHLTQGAFESTDEAVKVEFLLRLRGVGWPTASVILHFCDTRPYPILDWRAAWSLGFDRPPPYAMAFWLAYLDTTRALAARLGLPIRTLDMALWQYSKERQR